MDATSAACSTCWADENALTAALGFTLARSRALLARILERLLPGVPDGQTVELRWETRDEAGRTDLEIQAGDRQAVVEARRGWRLPGEHQLAAYAPRVHAVGNGVLATLSNASPEWAAFSLPAEGDGVPVRHLPWSTVRADLAEVRPASRGEQRNWLDELHEYLSSSAPDKPASTAQQVGQLLGLVQRVVVAPHVRLEQAHPGAPCCQRVPSTSSICSTTPPPDGAPCRPRGQPGTRQTGGVLPTLGCRC